MIELVIVAIIVVSGWAALGLSKHNYSHYLKRNQASRRARLQYMKLARDADEMNRSSELKQERTQKTTADEGKNDDTLQS